MVDVEVTVELAKRLKSYDQKIWDYLMSSFIKNIDQSRINKLPKITISGKQYTIGVYTNVTLGYDNDCCCAAILIGNHPKYSNQSLWMKIDYPSFDDYFNSDDQQPRILIRKDGEPSFIMPWEKSYNYVLGSDRIDYVNKNIDWINNNQETFDSFVDKKMNHE